MDFHFDNMAFHFKMTFFLIFTNFHQPFGPSVSPVAVANWIVEILKEAGVDTSKFKAHSLRSVSTTKALLKEASITYIKMHANWSLKANTFEDYYYKPYDNYKRSATMVEKIFSQVETDTTSEAETKATEVVLGTTYNSNVAVVETEDVVWTHRLANYLKKLI